MAKKQSGKAYNLGSIHTGSKATDPGVLKAQADKKKADANMASYKKKSAAKFEMAKTAIKKK